MPALSTAVPARSCPPNWDLVPFAVYCARCGLDLRGRAEPQCPACALEFDWADTCPIERLKCAHCGYHLYGLREPRCPECGKSFTWADALADYHRSKSDLFEYRWRDRPVRSFVKTWWRSLRPARFWKAIDIHDPPRIGALSAYFALLAALSCTPFCVLLPTLDLISNWGPTLTMYDILMVYVDSLFDTALWGMILVSLALLYGWTICTCGALNILRQSMVQCRIRNVHVMRACIYASTPVLMIAAPLSCLVIIAYTCMMTNVSWPIPPWARTLEQTMSWANWSILLSIPLFATWSIRCAYRHYVRMPHSFGVAICAELIAVLAIMAVATVIGCLFS